MVDYDEHLDRALDETPGVAEAGERFTVPDPVVRQEGHATVYENFQVTLDRLGREEQHVLKFLQNELGTSAQIDESGRARLTGSFDRQRVRETVEEYADAFVRCPECGLPDTQLVNEQGVEMLRCEACGARSSTRSET